MLRRAFFILLFFAFSSSTAHAYVQEESVHYSQYQFYFSLSPAGPDPGQEKGFHEDHPVKYLIYEWDADLGVLHARVFAMTPLTGVQGYRPNAKVTLELWYNGTFYRPFSYAKAYLLSPRLYVDAYHVPFDEAGNMMGYAEYGHSTSDLRTSGGSSYSIRMASLYALADYWHPNHEALYDHAEADVKLTVSNALLEFHWTELMYISHSPNPTINSPVTFTVALRDGVPPYTVKWNVNGQTQAVTQALGEIGEIAFSSVHLTFPTPGTYNITVTATDSVGISDAKWILVNVAAVYLNVQASTGGTTYPSPGTYAYARGQQVQVQAIPNSGYSLSHWELDGVVSGGVNPFTVIMDVNHTLKAIFVPSLSASLTASPSSGLRPLNVSFTCTASGGNPPYDYYLEFGDSGVFTYNASSTSIQTWHVYSQAGNYTARLTVTDSAGRKGYAFANVWVQEPPGQGLMLSLYKSNDIVIAPGQMGSSTIYVNASRVEPVTLSIRWIGNVPAELTASLSRTSVLPNATVTLSASSTSGTPPGNYTCRVVGTAGNVSAYVDVLVTVNPIVYYLTVIAGEGGTTNPSPGTYAHPAGARVQISSIPSSGWTFSVWRIDNNNIVASPSITVVMDSNHTVEAMFSRAQQTQSSLTLDVMYYESGVWKRGDQQKQLEFSRYGAIRWNGTNLELTSPVTISAPLGSSILIQFDPLNTEGRLLSAWGGQPKSKVWSARLYTSSGSYSQNVSPSSMTYPSSYSATLLPPSSILEIRLKWMDYPVNVTCNAPWGYAFVTSNSPGWGLYDYNYTNGFGVYYVDFDHDVTIKAVPFTGYYLDRIEVDGVSYYDDQVTISKVREPHQVKVHFSAVSPTFTLTIIATEGGTTIPSPGVYVVPRYSYQTVVAQVTNPSYYFVGWTLNGAPAGASSNLTVFMDGDKVVLAVFDTDLLGPVGPCSLTSGKMLKRVFVDERVGVNVTWQVPGISQPTQVQVTAWLDGAWWWDWNSKSFQNTTYKFTGTAVTDSQGRFTIKLGSFNTVFYSPAETAKPGDSFYAYANVTVGSQTYNLVSTWKVDQLMPWMTFTYNLTGAITNVTFRYATDGTLVKNRGGCLAASISVYDPMESGRLRWERLSTPCDDNGTAQLFIPYKDMKVARRSNATIVAWDVSGNHPFFIPSSLRVNITYTTVAAMIFFFNYTHMMIEPMDWGDPDLKAIEGAQAYLYWDFFEQPFNGTKGLLGPFGPSREVPLIKSEWDEYKAHINISGAIWPVGQRIRLDPTRTSITAITMQYPDAHQLMYNTSNPPRRFYLFVVPPPSEGVLYNPAVFMPDLVFHRPPTAEEVMQEGRR